MRNREHESLQRAYDELNAAFLRQADQLEQATAERDLAQHTENTRTRAAIFSLAAAVTHLTAKQPDAARMLADGAVRAMQPRYGACRDCGIRLSEPMHAGPCPSCDNGRGRMIPEGEPG